MNSVQIGGPDDIKYRAYFKVVTQINIDIPIINKIFTAPVYTSAKL